MAEAKPKKITGKPRVSNGPSEDAIQKKITTIKGAYDKFDKQTKIRLLKELGVGSDIFTCHLCGEPRLRNEFYASSEPRCKSGIARICKKCAAEIVNVDNGKGSFVPTRESVINVLCALNKPFLNNIWEAAILDAANSTGAKKFNTVWAAYISYINLPRYEGLTYEDSDMFTGGKYTMADMRDDALPKDKEIIDQFEKNKADVKRLLGYEPFEKERLADQPFLYSQLIGFIDSSEDANEDMLKISSSIIIVRSFLQEAQIDDKITSLMQDISNLDRNIGAIKQLQEIKQKLSSIISELAEQNCISQKHNKNAKKGENTWTGKIRKLKEMNLREQEVNVFDIGTCEGMRQVAEISDASIMKQIRLDENDYTEIVATQRENIVALQRSLEEWQEKARILLRENIDLKEYLSENNMLDEKMLSSDSILYEPSEESEG